MLVKRGEKLEIFLFALNRYWQIKLLSTILQNYIPTFEIYISSKAFVIMFYICDIYNSTNKNLLELQKSDSTGNIRWDYK